MSETKQPYNLFWIYQGSGYEAPTFVFNTLEEAQKHAYENGETDELFKDEMIDWEDRNIQQAREDELEDYAPIAIPNRNVILNSSLNMEVQ